jgi:hypothetical protein
MLFVVEFSNFSKVFQLKVLYLVSYQNYLFILQINLNFCVFRKFTLNLNIFIKLHFELIMVLYLKLIILRFNYLF